MTNVLKGKDTLHAKGLKLEHISLILDSRSSSTLDGLSIL